MVEFTTSVIGLEYTAPDAKSPPNQAIFEATPGQKTFSLIKQRDPANPGLELLLYDLPLEERAITLDDDPEALPSAAGALAAMFRAGFTPRQVLEEIRDRNGRVIPKIEE